MELTVYQPLSQDRREFRLARIKPTPHGDRDDHSIEVILEHASLNNPPTFTALSYTWEGKEDQATILVNTVPTVVRRNLYAALHQLRERALHDWIWIDAICIDQNDDAERSWQVNEMRSIFALADRVYCWLGPATGDSDAAFEMLKRIAQEVEDSGLTMDDIKPIGWGGRMGLGPPRFSTPGAEEARLALCKKLFDYEELESKDGSFSQGAAVVQKLLHRSFFSRVWIIQEYSLAKHCQFVCGQSSLDTHTLDISIEAIGLAMSYRRTLSPTTWRQAKFFSPFNWTYLDSKLFQVRQAMASGSPPNLYDIIVIQSDCPERPLYAASDPRDIVFGVLGCAADAESLGLQADYSKPVNQVFAEVTKAFIRQEKPYQLGHCSFLKDMPGLPSWVLDWKRLGEFGIGFYPINYSVHFKANDGLFDALDDADPGEWKVLRTTGWHVDVVRAVMKPTERRVFDPYSSPFLSLESQMRWLLEIVEFFQLDSSGQADEVAVWRTVVKDQQYQGERTTQAWQELAPRVFRDASLEVEELTPDQLRFIKNFTPDGTVESFKNRCLTAMESSCRFKTLFKTGSGKIGLGPEVMLAGDIVTILHSDSSPIILRPENDKYYSFVGDAYVHSIMDGEFAATEPELRFFELI
ncbi:heterokaryon incompatibility protein-domain-containing protein [Nemania abortiva]|nr:heterokaryon incompatibility protein-domain-containing protein [Nemania abortiva]